MEVTEGPGDVERYRNLAWFSQVRLAMINRLDSIASKPVIDCDKEEKQKPSLGSCNDLDADRWDLIS